MFNAVLRAPYDKVTIIARITESIVAYNIGSFNFFCIWRWKRWIKRFKTCLDWQEEKSFLKPKRISKIIEIVIHPDGKACVNYFLEIKKNPLSLRKTANSFYYILNLQVQLQGHKKPWESLPHSQIERKTYSLRGEGSQLLHYIIGRLQWRNTWM